MSKNKGKKVCKRVRNEAFWKGNADLNTFGEKMHQKTVKKFEREAGVKAEEKVVSWKKTVKEP